MVPTPGPDHVTAVFEAPVMLAVNAADWPLVIEIHVGLTEIPTKGIRVTVADSGGYRGNSRWRFVESGRRNGSGAWINRPSVEGLAGACNRKLLCLRRFQCDTRWRYRLRVRRGGHREKHYC